MILFHRGADAMRAAWYGALGGFFAGVLLGFVVYYLVCAKFDYLGFSIYTPYVSDPPPQQFIYSHVLLCLVAPCRTGRCAGTLWV